MSRTLSPFETFQKILNADPGSGDEKGQIIHQLRILCAIMDKFKEMMEELSPQEKENAYLLKKHIEKKEKSTRPLVPVVTPIEEGGNFTIDRVYYRDHLELMISQMCWYLEPDIIRQVKGLRTSEYPSAEEIYKMYLLRIYQENNHKNPELDEEIKKEAILLGYDLIEGQSGSIYLKLIS